MEPEIAGLWVDAREDGWMTKVLVGIDEGAVVTTSFMYGGIRITLVTVPPKGQGEPEPLGVLYLNEVAQEGFRAALDAQG